MLLKARPAAGDRLLATSFIQQVRPFVFRRFLDFQALDELREMRDRILAETSRLRPGWDRFDVKLGIGGIREIEFLVQSLQLVYGGREPALDEPSTLRCLDKLAHLSLLSVEVAGGLKEAYTFLRRVEHWVQLDQNRQTQKLPSSEEAMSRLALVLGFGGDVARFRGALEEHCRLAHEHFSRLFQPAKVRVSACSGGIDDEPCLPAVSAVLGPEVRERLRSSLVAVPESLSRPVLTAFGSLPVSGPRELPEKAVNRLDQYLAKIRRRRGLMKVFEGNGDWIGPFFSGLMCSELLAGLLIPHPSLVEGVATSNGRWVPHERWAVHAEAVLARCDDYEEGLEWLRRLKNERTLQLALALLGGRIDHRTLEQELTRLARFFIGHTLHRVLADLHMPLDPPLAVLGLGRLGSAEMGFLSDLDLVFVYEPEPGQPPDTIPEEVVRLIQRFIRMLSTPLQEGPGYAVDARLRPTGSYGPLVVTRKSWLDYYTRQADLWEIQALIRMSCVAGRRSLGEAVEKDAQAICFRERDPGPVWKRLCHLRQRMQHERADERGGAVDIKLGEGGLTDFEFLIQGLQLTEGFQHEPLRVRSVREAMEPALLLLGLSPAAVREHAAEFRTLRALEHRLRLYTGQASSRLQPWILNEMKAGGLWSPSAETRLQEWEDLPALRRRVRNLFRSRCPEIR